MRESAGRRELSSEETTIMAQTGVRKSLAWQVIAALPLVAVIIVAILVARSRQEAFTHGAGALKPAVVSKVAPGEITMDGRPDEWRALGRYPLTGPNAPAAGGSSWKELRLAHDGSNLYLLVTLGRTVEEECQRLGARVSLGIISLDIGAELGGAEAAGGDEQAFESDCDIGLCTDPQGTPPRAGIAYILQGRGVVAPEGAIAIRKTSRADPDRVGFDGRNVEIAIPLSELGIAPPARLVLAVHPFQATRVQMFGVRIE